MGDMEEDPALDRTSKKREDTAKRMFCGLGLPNVLLGMKYGEVVQPEMYNRAADEIIFVVIIICGIVTWLSKPELYKDNALKTVLGYNSPCIVWDSVPSCWVGLPIWMYVVYFNTRFNVLSYQRALVLNLKPLWIHFFVGVGYTISTTIVPLSFSILPSQHWKAHFLCFAQVIPFRYLVVAVNYVAFPENVTRRNVMFLVLFTIASLGEVGGNLLAVLFYDDSWAGLVPGNPHVVNPLLQQIIDYTWFALLPITSVFAVQTPGLVINLKVEVPSTQIV
jgi:hypothetical protein